MCGLVGIVGHEPVNQSLYDALTVLQHRGQDAAGIMTDDGGRLRIRKGNGLVRDVFQERHMLKLAGNVGLGHVRYPTAGSSSLSEAQPFYVNSPYGICLAHNGNLVNAQELKRELEVDGSIFQSSMDTEVIIHLIARSRKERIEDRIVDALNQVRGAYSLLFMTRDKLIGVRDPGRSRPALERLGADAWAAALDYIYDEGFRRGTGEPDDYAALFADPAQPSLFDRDITDIRASLRPA